MTAWKRHFHRDSRNWARTAFQISFMILSLSSAATTVRSIWLLLATELIIFLTRLPEKLCKIKFGLTFIVMMFPALNLNSLLWWRSPVSGRNERRRKGKKFETGNNFIIAAGSYNRRKRQSTAATRTFQSDTQRCTTIQLQRQRNHTAHSSFSSFPVITLSLRSTAASKWNEASTNLRPTPTPE